MAIRGNIFHKDGYYHVYNKTLDDNKIFRSERYSERFYKTLRFYKSDIAHRYRLSAFLEKPENDQEGLYLDSSNLFEIHAYCFMPNHYHILMKQTTDTDISTFIKLIMDSFTKTYNVINDRKGPVFLTGFKAKPVTTDEQFIHVARYIHLNPYSSSLVQTFSDLRQFRWSSYGHYCCQDRDVLVDDYALYQHFRIASSPARLIHFTEDQADWQKTLAYINED